MFDVKIVCEKWWQGNDNESELERYEKFYKEFYRRIIFELESKIFLTNLEFSKNRFFLHEIILEFLICFNKIVEKIHERKISNLIVEEPTLEEIFMHYYEQEA